MSGGFGFPFGCVAAVVAVLLADVAGAPSSPWYALVTLGAVVLLSAFWTTAVAAAGVLAVAWALDAGFVLGRAGELRFDPASAVAAAILAATLALGLLARTRHRPPVPIPAPRHPSDVPSPGSLTTAN